MNIEIVLPVNFDSYSDVKKKRLSLLCYELLEYMKIVNYKYFFHDRDKLLEYLLLKKISSDESKQILKHLNKLTVSSTSKNDVLNNIKQKVCDKYLSICIDIDSNANNQYYISNKDKLIELKCNCYEKKINKNNFIEYCNMIFDKLCYSKTIGRSLNSISKYIKTSRGKILKHLQVLSSDDFNKAKNTINSFRDIRALLIPYNIECSVSADRSKVNSYYFICNNKELNVKCEPHTKLDSNQDNCIRIYFHPGMKDFCDNKVLIGHIGEHL